VTLVVGVDGWREGWIALSLRHGGFERAVSAGSFAGILAAFPQAAAIGVDMPIGLPPPYPRAADAAARAFLAPHAARVFATHVREVYEAATHAEAARRARGSAGAAISLQSWRLRGKILELDRHADERVFEVHPEVSFRALTGRPLASKRTWDGQMARREALASAGIVLPADIGPAGLAPPDDVLDAAAAAWSAGRIARGEASTLPADPPRDARGRLVAIWF
jgi:predicted RNase H-like nuclease